LVDQNSIAGRGANTQRADIVKVPWQKTLTTGKSQFAKDCVVGLRGLELRANHAVAIEPISGWGHLADFLRSNVG
jgi:hypothetical protein